MAEHLKLPEVARRLDVSEKTARRYIKSGALPSVFIGRTYRVSEEDLEAFLKNAKVIPGDDSPKAQSPLQLDDVAGTELLKRALDAARQDDEKDAQAITRLGASEGVAQSVSGYAEDEFRAELRKLGFPDEYFEGFLWPLVQKAHMAEQMQTLIGIAFPEDDYRNAMDRAFRKRLEDARS